MTNITTVLVAHARELSRRRTAIGLLIALPLAFYASAAAAEGAFVLVTGGMGVAWAITGAGLFIGLGSRAVAPRLILNGYRPHELLAGQMVLLAGFAVPLLALFTTLLLAAEQPEDPAAVAVAIPLVAFISVPLGLLLGSLARSELEGTLSLIGVLGVQMSLPVTTAGAAVLPFYGPVALLEHAYGTDLGIAAAIPHALGVIALLTAGSFVAWRRRVRVA